MPQRSSKPQDENQIAAGIIAEISGAVELYDQSENAATVLLGRLGGLKGGKARAEKLSLKRRKQIAKKAAKTRWQGHQKRKKA